MKKWLGIGLLVGLFFLTGCTKLPQDQFADGLTVQKDMNAGDFSVTIHLNLLARTAKIHKKA